MCNQVGPTTVNSNTRSVNGGDTTSSWEAHKLPRPAHHVLFLHKVNEKWTWTVNLYYGCSFANYKCDVMWMILLMMMVVTTILKEKGGRGGNGSYASSCLSTLHILTHLILKMAPQSRYYRISIWFELLKVTQLPHSKARIHALTTVFTLINPKPHILLKCLIP